MDSLRLSIPALANKYYFNYGGQGPLPSPSLKAITNSWKKIQELGPFTNNVWPYLANEISLTRKSLAQVCGVSSNRLTFTENVTSGCILPLLGLPFSSGDRLLISDCEHPGIMAACQELSRRKNLEIDIFTVKNLRRGLYEQDKTDSDLLNTLEKSLKPRTRLVVLSHLLWNTGQVMPIAKVSTQLANHPNKPFLLVDAAQSFGQLPIKTSASMSDIYAFTGHKWSLGPEGLGAVVLSERVIMETNPTLIGWRSLKNEGKFSIGDTDPFHKDSRRFEVATSCIPLMAGLRTSIQLLEKEGNSEYRLRKILEKSKILWEEITGINGIKTLLNTPPPSGLVSFFILKEPSPEKVVKWLGSKKVWIRGLESPPCLRACLHITSSKKDIKELVKNLMAFIDKS